MPEHDTRGAKLEPRGKLGHATHGTCARGPNADVIFVSVWSSYISFGVGHSGLFPPSHPASAFTTIDHAPSRLVNQPETLPIRWSTLSLSLPVDARLFPLQHV